jgi:hypothetical protein
MHRYDVLKETWIYQEIRQEVVEEQRQAYIEEQQQMVCDIIKARFPRVETLGENVVKKVRDVVILRDLLVQISSSKTEKEARQYLSKFAAHKQ